MVSENIELLCEIWSTLNEYIPAKEKAIAAEHLISMLADYGFEAVDLKMFAGGDKHLKSAIVNYLGDDDDDDDDDDYE